MERPSLIVIAGCNGSGKSTFSKHHNNSIEPFDFDKRYLEIYRSLSDSELRDKFARDKTTKEFESSIEGAFLTGKDFCYETNFDSTPIYWPQRAKALGYNLELYFYCLQTRELANKRVAMRTANKGHFIEKKVVYYKWKEGYNNLNLHYQLFDYIYLLDNSAHLKTPKALFSLMKSEEEKYIVERYAIRLPNYSRRRFPDIYKLVIENNEP